MTEADVPSLDVSAETVRMYARDNNLGMMEAKRVLFRQALVDNIVKAETVDDLKIVLLQMLKFG